MNNTLFASVDQYIENFFAEEDDILLKIRNSITEANLPNQSVSANQGKFLYTLARLCNAKRILEIGTFAGYSTTWLARALPDHGKLITLEFDPFHALIAKQNIINAGLQFKVDVRVGKALDSLAQLMLDEEEPFDMIFIDADKPPYTEYFDWAVRLARPGALIVSDNVVRDGKILDEFSTDEKVKGVQRFNTMLAKDQRVTATILQMVGVKDYDGMAIAVVNRLV